MARLGLGVPEASWLVARDRIAEFVGLLALITGTLAKLGNEVYNLQRPELGELSEAPTEGVVGSITMPQKRNPGALRASVDARADRPRRRRASRSKDWSASTSATAPPGRPSGPSSRRRRPRRRRRWRFARELVEGLRVDEVRMRANLDAQRGYVLAEPAMLALAERIGKHRAHELVHRAALAGQEAGVTLEEALAADAEIAAALPRDELAALLAPERALGAAGETVDAVIARGRAR